MISELLPSPSASKVDQLISTPISLTVTSPWGIITVLFPTSKRLNTLTIIIGATRIRTLKGHYSVQPVGNRRPSYPAMDLYRIHTDSPRAHQSRSMQYWHSMCHDIVCILI